MARLRFLDSLRNGICVVLAAVDLLELVEVRPRISQIGVEGHSAIEPCAWQKC